MSFSMGVWMMMRRCNFIPKRGIRTASVLGQRRVFGRRDTTGAFVAECVFTAVAEVATDLSCTLMRQHQVNHFNGRNQVVLELFALQALASGGITLLALSYTFPGGKYVKVYNLLYSQGKRVYT